MRAWIVRRISTTKLVTGTLAVGLLGLPSAGCSKKSKPAKMSEEEREQSERRREGAGKKVRKERVDRMAASVCDKLECSDDQRTKVGALVAAYRSGGMRPQHGLGGDHAATKALAEAFRGDALDAAAFSTFREAEHEARNKSQLKRRNGTAEALVELHASLSADQRTKLSALVSADGLGFLRAGRPGGPRAGARRHQPDAAQRAERMATRLCKQVTCGDQQSDTVVDLFTKLSTDRGEDNPAANTALATALAGDKLDAGAVDTYFDTRDDGRTSVEAANDAVWVELHGVLDSGQRSKLADQLEEHGVGALMGHSGRTRRLGGLGRSRG